MDDRENGGFPEPGAVAREGIEGTPATLADGREWLLADGGLGNELDEARDRLFDECLLAGSVVSGDVLHVALVLLLANYDLELDEGVRLVAAVPAKELMPAVFEALFGPRDAVASYTDWARSSLLANGLDPDAIPARDRPFVLRQLVDTGRAIPAGRFCDAAEAAGDRAAILALAKPAGAV